MCFFPWIPVQLAVKAADANADADLLTGWLILADNKFKRTGTKRLQMAPKDTGEGLLNGTLSRHDPLAIILFLFITVPQPKETCARRGEALKHLLWPSFHLVCVTAATLLLSLSSRIPLSPRQSTPSV
jgi:hypothetical protein